MQLILIVKETFLCTRIDQIEGLMEVAMSEHTHTQSDRSGIHSQKVLPSGEFADGAQTV